MKNIFKFMGIALMACSLTFVSCNKDDDDTNTPENPENPIVEDGGFSLVWDGQTQNPGYVNAITNSQIFLFNAAQAMDNEGMTLPAFQLWLLNGAGEGNTPTVENFGLSVYFQNYRSQYPNYVFESEIFQDQQGNQMGDYQIYDVNEEVIGAIDITALSVNVKYDIVFFSYRDVMSAYQAALAENPNYQVTDDDYSNWVEQATKKNLVWNLVNYKFTAQN